MVKYDVIYVDFPHRQHNGTSSKHPAVVLDGNTIARLAAQVSSKLEVIAPTDYLLKDWKQAGLNKPSKVRLGQQEAFTEDSVITQFGHLSDEDIEGIEAMLYNKSLNEEVIEVGDSVYDPVKDEYYFVSYHPYHRNDNTQYELLSRNKKHIAFIDKGSPLWNRLILKDKHAFPLKEDTIKIADGKWVNIGDDGETHGEFKTKKEADAQRRAMFARGFKK